MGQVWECFGNGDPHWSRRERTKAFWQQDAQRQNNTNTTPAAWLAWLYVLGLDNAAMGLYSFTCQCVRIGDEALISSGFLPSGNGAHTPGRLEQIRAFCVSGGRKCRVDSGPEWAGCTEYTDLITPVSASCKLSAKHCNSHGDNGETSALMNRIAASSASWLSASRQWGRSVSSGLSPLGELFKQ